MSLLAALLPTLAGTLDKLLPDPEARAKAQLELAKLEQDGQFREIEARLQESLAQAEINKIEAASQNGFQAGWRPLAGYACVAGLGYEFLLRPLLPWLLVVSGVQAPDLPSLDGVLFELMFGMLGLGTLRTADRWQRVKAISKSGKT